MQRQSHVEESCRKIIGSVTCHFYFISEFRLFNIHSHNLSSKFTNQNISTLDLSQFLKDKTTPKWPDDNKFLRQEAETQKNACKFYFERVADASLDRFETNDFSFWF